MLLSKVAEVVQRARHVWRPPRASWSYRYQLMADQSGPMSAVHYLAFQELRIRNHAQFEGAAEPHPLRGVDEATRATAREEVADD
jgi:hypothetical protein